MLTILVWIVRYYPAIFVRRLDAGPGAEQSTLQKIIVTALPILTVLWFVLPGLDHRYGWSHIARPVSLAGMVGAFGGLFLAARVTVLNQYMNGTIAVEKGQTVIQTGPYAIVRHPLYACSLIWFGFTPIALGSWWSLLLMLPLVLVFTLRLLDEERTLKVQLDGYAEYCAKVRSRLIPWVF
jgi:protein-S-isoprenylcysteine O-methyltransferase Ste14